MRIFVLVVLTVFPLFSFSQTGNVNGTLNDSKGSPVPYANVLLLQASDSSLVKGSVTDESGKFTLEEIAFGKYVLMFSFIGYEKSYSQAFELNESQTEFNAGTQILAEGTSTLDEVSVVAQKPFIEKHFDKTVVNVENSIVAAGNTALEVLKRSPGVMVDKDGNISLKGKSGLTIMIDGKPTYLSSQDISNMLSNLPADQVEKIEIITNPSARYDAAGQGGIINIVMKKNQNIGLNGSAQAGYSQGFYARYNAGFNMNYRLEKWNFFGSYNYNNRSSAGWFELTRKFRVNDQIESIFNQSSFGRDSSQTHTGKVGIDFFPNKKHNIGIFVNGIGNAGGNSNSNHTYISGPGGEPISSSYTHGVSTQKWSNVSANLNYKWVMDSSGTELTANLDYAVFDQNNPQNFTTLYYDSLGSYLGAPYFLRSQLPSHVDIKSGKIDFSKTISKKFRLEAGLKSSYVTTDNNAQYYNVVSGIEYVDTTKTNHFKYTENINAAYLNGQFEFSEKLQLQFGLRVENTNALGEQITIDSTFERHYTKLFPSGVLNYKLNKKHDLNFTYSRRIDRPDYQDLNPFLYFLDPYTFMQGNTLLLPQYTNSFELSHTYLGFLSTTIGYSKTEGVITQVTYQVDSTRTTYATNKNLNSLENWTISTMLPVPIAKWWTSMNFITAYHNRYQGSINNNGDNFDLGMWSFMVNSMNQLQFKKGWGAEITAFYMSRQVYGIFTMKPMSNITVGLQKKILKEKGTIKVSASDLMWKSRFRGSVVYENMDIQMNAWNDSRVYTVSFSYKFGNSKAQYQRKEGGANDEIDRIKKGGNGR